MKLFSRILILFFIFCFASYAAPKDELMQWNESPQFAVEINGKVELFAHVYQPHDYKPFIILVTKELKQIVLMNLTTKEVSTLDPSVFKKKDEIEVFTEKIPTGKKFGTYSIQKGVSMFSAEGKKIGIRMKETLVGEVSLGMLLAHSPLYAALRDQYKPNKKSIDFLKSYSKPVELVVMFATWCPTCKQMVPKLLRILKDANNPKFSVKYIGIAMGGNEPRDLLNKYGDDYPAFIFYEGGKEKGRIIGMTPNPIEETIVAVLKK